ncbi:MAG: hypothetical protein IH600_00370, partial [Bacteroidetes bacterium]|nr:hypothetical protein [Bacteroidota bacterium]
EWTDYGGAIREPAAFQAYLDLLEYAQEALPVLPYGVTYDEAAAGWRAESYELGGEYFLGDAEEAVAVLVTVEDRGTGSYLVTDARVVARGVYFEHLSELERWREARQRRVDVFE